MITLDVSHGYTIFNLFMLNLKLLVSCLPHRGKEHLCWYLGFENKVLFIIYQLSFKGMIAHLPFDSSFDS